MCSVKKDRSKNILFLINEFGRGGAERVVHHLVNQIPQKTNQLLPSIFLLEKSEITYPVPEQIEIHIGSKNHRSNLLKLIKIPLLAWKLKQVIGKRNIILVISFLNRANYVNLIARSLGSKHIPVISERNTASQVYQSANLKDRLNRCLIKLLYPCSDRIIAVSTGVQSDLVDQFKIPGQMITVINNPYDIKGIQNQAREEIIHPWLGNIEYYTIVAVGRLEAQKNYLLLINAFARTIKNIKKLRLVIIGEGSQRPELIRQINNLDLSEYVELLGSQQNPFKYISRATCYVLSSDFEGFPNSLVEAMACGVPVVSTNCPSGPDEIITHGKNGFLVPVNDASALSEAITTLIQNTKMRDKFSNAAKNSVEKFSQSLILEQYLQFIEERIHFQTNAS